MRKAIVLMTDGANNWFDSPNGFPGACTERSADASSAPGGAAAPGPPMAHRPVACPPAGQEGRVQAAPGAPAIAGNADYTGYGRLAERRLGPGIGNNSQAQAEVNTRMSQLCTLIKSRGVTLYTVVLDTSGSAVNAQTRAIYEACASSPANHFLVTRADQLRPVFRQIGTELANLRLVP